MELEDIETLMMMRIVESKSENTSEKNHFCFFCCGCCLLLLMLSIFFFSEATEGEDQKDNFIKGKWESKCFLVLIMMMVVGVGVIGVQESGNHL